MSKEKPLSKVLLGIVELVVLIIVTVSLVLAADYLVVAWFFEPVFKWNFVYTFIMGTVFEGFAFIFIGIRFLQKKVEVRRKGYAGISNVIIPDLVPIPRSEVARKSRPKLGAILIGAGVVLFILDIVIFPIYYKI